MRSRLRPHAWTLLVTLLAVVLLNGVLVAGLIAYGVPAGQALHQTAPGRSTALLNHAGNDSWKPMARAQRAFHDQPDASLYRVFFADHIKFQYPPSALFVLDLFPSRWFDGPDSLQPGSRMNQLLTWASRLAVAFAMFVCVLLYERSWRHTHGDGTAPTRDRLIVVICVVLLGAMFYPIVRAHILGQIQIFIDCLVAAALLAYMTGWRGLAGVCIGVCCLIKPQYGLLLLWGLLRRDWRFSVGLVAVAAAGVTAALFRYGFENHLEYLRVLRFIAQHGEAYWPNQSVNGLLNRLLNNGDPLHFDRYSFPPYHAVVYFGTLLSSLAIVTIALWPVRGRSVDALDLAIALLGATLAAPVAWEHHFGILLPIFALATPIVLLRSASKTHGLLLLASYLMVANALLRPAWLLADPVRELLASHLFFGALLLFAILVGARLKPRQSPASR
jgi:alpha-1,2-mannosyltransferase